MALSRDPQAQQDLKTYLALLDMTSRQNLLKELQEMFSADRDFPKWPPSTTSSWSEGYPVFWNLLYAKNMRCVRIPVIATSSSDVHARGEGTQSGRGEGTQSGRGEDNNGTAEGQQQKSQRGLGHQHQSEVYANIFSVLGSIVGEMLPSTTQELHLDCYRKAPPATFREKGLIFNLIEGFRNVTKLNLGLGCDDSTLKEIARQVSVRTKCVVKSSFNVFPIVAI